MWNLVKRGDFVQNFLLVLEIFREVSEKYIETVSWANSWLGDGVSWNVLILWSTARHLSRARERPPAAIGQSSEI